MSAITIASPYTCKRMYCNKKHIPAVDKQRLAQHVQSGMISRQSTDFTITLYRGDIWRTRLESYGLSNHFFDILAIADALACDSLILDDDTPVYPELPVFPIQGA